MNNNDNQKKGLGKDAATQAASLSWNKIKKRFLLWLAPAGGILLLTILCLIAIIAIFENFNSAFALMTGKDPFDTIGDGMKVATEVVDSYNEASSTSYLETCKTDMGLFEWFSTLFTGNITDECQLIAYIQDTAQKLEKENKIVLDRGLIIGTFLYAYINQSPDQIFNKEGKVLDAADPLKLLKYMLEEDANKVSANVKITKIEIGDLFNAEMTEYEYMALTWGIVKSEVVTKYGSDGTTVESKTTTNYHGCTVTPVSKKELDVNKYNIYLRDKRQEVLGRVSPLIDSNYEGDLSLNTLTDASGNPLGYVSAKNHQKVLESATGLCPIGEFKPSKTTSGKNTVISVLAPSDGTTQDGKKYVTMQKSQKFVSKIIDNKWNDFGKYLVTADPSVLTPDDLTITNNLNLNYSKGFIYDKFTLYKTSWDELTTPKNIEKSIIDINTNAVYMNEALNYPSNDLFGTNGGVVDNLPVVIGDEADPLGDFNYYISSCYGPRNLSSSPNHTGIDLAQKNPPISGKGIYAWKDGTVVAAGMGGTYGYFVRILHKTLDGESTVVSVYAHLQNFPSVKVGTEVKAGDLIGLVGSTGNVTGPHLHFDIKVNGVFKNPKSIVKIQSLLDKLKKAGCSDFEY